MGCFLWSVVVAVAALSPLLVLLSVPMALVGWMPPWLAGLGMAGSSLLVVGNALRLTSKVPSQSSDTASGKP